MRLPARSRTRCATLLFIVLAVFYRGALDPRIALKRTTVYGLMVVFAPFAFALLEGVVADALLSLAGLSQSWASWITGALIALTLHPLHELVRRQADRWLGD